MLECKIIKKTGDFTLDIDMKADGVCALMGASGSGKSMTLSCIAGILKPDSGKIVLGDTVLYDSEKKINLPPQRRNVGLLFQDYALFPNMTILQNIMCGANEMNKKSRKAISENLAEVFRIEKHLNKYPHQLSGGEKQRTALARIFVATPDVLMLDEPFSALDSHLRWELENELAAVFGRYKNPVLYVSHNRDEVYRLCDDLIVVNKGKTEVNGDKWDLFNNPETVQAARLTGCKNIAPCEVRGTKMIVADWGIEYDTKQMCINLEKVEYIGIRANYIKPAYQVNEDEVTAAFEFEIVREIEDTFTCILYVRKKGTSLPSLRWEMPKKDRAALCSMPQKLALLKKHVLFLKK